MLKKIQTAQVLPGMFVHALEGSWLAHPFWKTRFLLTDSADLVALQRSKVSEVWIDISKGRDVDGGPAAPTLVAVPAAEDPRSDTVPVRAPVSTIAPVGRMGIEEELERAAQVLRRSKEAVTAMFNEVRLGKVVRSDDFLPVVSEVADSLARNPSAFVSLARLKTKDDYTYMHSIAVCALMVGLARQLGFDDASVREAGLAGLLHDVGKMLMPPDVLNKPGALTDEEMAVMRTHPERGLALLQEGPSTPAGAIDVCLHHHEKHDGTGYPYGLAGDQISLLARMGAVCDVYDAITSTRPYKAAWDPAASIQRMSQWKGQFDSAVFAAFVKSVGIYPVGTLVRLVSGRLAVVVDQNPAAPAAPTVRVFFSTKSDMPVPLTLIDLAARGTTERIQGRESAEDWGFKHLQELWNPKALRA